VSVRAFIPAYPSQHTHNIDNFEPVRIDKTLWTVGPMHRSCDTQCSRHVLHTHAHIPRTLCKHRVCLASLQCFLAPLYTILSSFGVCAFLLCCVCMNGIPPLKGRKVCRTIVQMSIAIVCVYVCIYIYIGVIKYSSPQKESKHNTFYYYIFIF